MHAEAITITVRYSGGTYVARARGSRHTASCTHDLVLAARNLARKLDLDVLGMKRGPDREGVATFEAWPLTSGPIAEIYGELWRKASSMGYESVTEALADLERRKVAEQPDTVQRELLERVYNGWARSTDVAGPMRELRAMLDKEGI
ncbi:hypothetical protein D3C78_505900 [compost metagenome]